jgi:GR25 family glycosyltransferase involved in LPS biosynthesis
MNEAINYKFYCLSYNNNERKTDLNRRFNSININCDFYNGVSFEDERIKKHSDRYNPHKKRVMSCTYGHLDMINNFYNNTDKDFGIFCEDDIFIHKNLGKHLPKIISDMGQLNIDVLLLGYLVPFKIQSIFKDYSLKPGSEKIKSENEINYNYHNFPDDIWGTQMYILTRKQAQILLDKYSEENIDTMLSEGRPIAADFLFTKEGNRALITPILVVEDNKTIYDDYYQNLFHKDSFAAHYDKDLFIS